MFLEMQNYLGEPSPYDNQSVGEDVFHPKATFSLADQVVKPKNID